MAINPKPVPAGDAPDGWRQSLKDMLDTITYVEYLVQHMTDYGYKWSKEVFLPTGTVLRVTSDYLDHYAFVGRSGIRDERGNVVTPEEFVSSIFGPEKDPWRAVSFKRPEDLDWTLAYDMNCNVRPLRMPKRGRRATTRKPD